jgi:hypothetical protein
VAAPMARRRWGAWAFSPVGPDSLSVFHTVKPLSHDLERVEIACSHSGTT